MARSIRRIKPTLFDSIDTQIEKSLRNSGLDSVKAAVSKLNRDQLVINSVISNGAAMAIGTDLATTSPDVGYDYSTDPPTPDTDYPSTSARIDNIDDYLVVTLAAALLALQSASASWYTIQYIPDEEISSITLPHVPIDVRVYKNGLRQYEGASYDYTVVSDVIFIAGIAEDRFIIDYSCIESGS